MVDRLRALFEAPHDPSVARAIVVFASVVTLGLTVVVGLGGAGGSVVASGPTRTPAAGASTTPAQQVVPRRQGSPARYRSRPRQDPQDRTGSPAAHRARRELASHRALQHVPFRHGGITITLVGADGTRAVLRIEAASLPDARRGWRGFLRRYRDDGRAYLPRFEARRRRVRDRVRSQTPAIDRCGAARHSATVGPGPRVAVVFAVPVAVPVAGIRDPSADSPRRAADPRPRISPRSPLHLEVTS